MDTTAQDILQVQVTLSGLVLVSQEAQQFLNFRKEIGENVLISQATLPSTPEVPEAETVLSLPRERITIAVSRLLTRASIEFPSALNNLERLSDVIQAAITTFEGSNQLLSRIGYSIDIVYTQLEDPPSSLIASRLVNSEVLRLVASDAKWQVVGGNVAFDISDGVDFRQLAVQPIANTTPSRVFLRYSEFTAEQAGQAIPDKGAMLSSLEDVWSKAHKIIRDL